MMILPEFLIGMLFSEKQTIVFNNSKFHKVFFLMKKKSILALIITASILFFSCSGVKTNDGLTLSSEKLQMIVKEKPKTLLFFWTSWCGASHYVLENTYKNLADSLEKLSINANIILLCASANQDSTIKVLSELSGIQSYYMENPGSGVAPLDRYRIKKFLNTNFGKDNQKLITGGDFQFGIPISIIVNNENELINSNAPQEAPYLIKLLAE